MPGKTMYNKKLLKNQKNLNEEAFHKIRPHLKYLEEWLTVSILRVHILSKMPSLIYRCLTIERYRRLEFFVAREVGAYNIVLIDLFY